jgi:hypothetical protein
MTSFCKTQYICDRHKSIQLPGGVSGESHRKQIGCTINKQSLTIIKFLSIVNAVASADTSPLVSLYLQKLSKMSDTLLDSLRQLFTGRLLAADEAHQVGIGSPRTDEPVKAPGLNHSNANITALHLSPLQD